MNKNNEINWGFLLKLLVITIVICIFIRNLTLRSAFEYETTCATISGVGNSGALKSYTYIYFVDSNQLEGNFTHSPKKQIDKNSKILVEYAIKKPKISFVKKGVPRCSD